jgi:hypothetical protein
MGSGGIDYPPGDTEMRSVQGGGIHTGGWRAFLDEVSQDLEDLRGVGDHGDNLYGFVTTRAAQRIGFVDLLDQAGPCGAALLGRHRELGLRLLNTEKTARAVDEAICHFSEPRVPAAAEARSSGVYGFDLLVVGSPALV